jgi:hypothetical protein
MAKRFDVPILIAAALVIPALVIEESNVSRTWKHVVFGFSGCCASSVWQSLLAASSRWKVSGMWRYSPC